MVKKHFKISISIEKRLILHLANHIDLRDSFEVSAAVTQQGIADAIGIHFEHIPRALKNLLIEGVVYERKAHVKEFYRRKKIYFLTTKGIEYANEITQWFDNKSIHIHTLEGEIREIKFKQLKEFLNFKLNPLDAYKYSSESKHGIIDLNQVQHDKNQLNLAHGLKID